MPHILIVAMLQRTMSACPNAMRAAVMGPCSSEHRLIPTPSPTYNILNRKLSSSPFSLSWTAWKWAIKSTTICRGIMQYTIINAMTLVVSVPHRNRTKIRAISPQMGRMECVPEPRSRVGPDWTGLRRRRKSSRNPRGGWHFGFFRVSHTLLTRIHLGLHAKL